jgi:hypothetical protein
MVSSVPKNMFTSTEIRKHRDTLDVFTDAAADFLDWVYADHLAFYDKWGVSKYYGNRKPEHKTYEKRVAQLKKFGKPAFLADQQVSTACILLAMQAMERGFNETGMGNTWKKINAQLKIDQKFYGTDLQIMLQQLGWKLYYWNPDPSQNAKWDAQDQELNPLKPGRKWMPVWGGHALRYASAKNKGTYYDAKVDNVTDLVGFGKVQPPAFKNVPVFVGIAHAGYHVFPGRRGDVIEAHSMRSMIAKDNIEVAPFNPLATGGAPRWTNSEKYRSGLIAVPQDF